MRVFNLLLAGTTALAALAVAKPANAQEAQTSTTDELIVTARAGAGDRRLAEASYAITTLSEEELRLQAPISTAETFKAIPGFWVEASGGEASNNVRSRGIPTDGFSSVTIQEDGLTIQHDGALGWLNADQSFRLDETIGRVEAVRGGPASIFASNSPGGTVNFITKKAGDVAEGVVKVTVGDYGLYRTDFFYGAPIGEGWGVTIGGFFRSDEGVRDPGFTQNEGGQIRVGLSRDFERGRLDINVKHLDDNVGFLLPIPLTFDGDGDPTGVPGFDENYGTLAGPDNRLLSFRNVGGPFSFDLGRGTDVSLTAITVNLELDVGGGWELRNIARYRTSDILRNGLFPTGSVRSASAELAELQTQTPGQPPLSLRYASTGESFNIANQNGNGLVVRGNLLSVSVPLDEFTNDIRLAKQFQVAGQTHDVAVGVYASSYEYDYDRFMATALLEVRDQARRLDVVAQTPGGPVPVTENGFLRYGSLFDNATVEARVLAAYLSDEWQVTERLRIDAGVRHETVDYSGAVEGKTTVNLGESPTISDDSVITGTGQFAAIDRNYTGTSLTVGANYQVTPNFGVFARYTDTERLPSASDFQGDVNQARRTDDKVTPVTFYEAGVKYQSPLIDVFATAFLSQFEGVRFTDNVFNSATNTFTQRFGFADTETFGVEIEGIIAPVTWFDVAVQASWQQPEYENFTFTENRGGAPVTVTFDGRQLIRVPETALRIVPGVNLLGDTLRAELPIEYYSERFADIANTQELPSYTVLNANVRWDLSERFALSLNGVNLTNEIGLTEGNPRAGQFVSGDAGARFFLARPILGRSWRLAATYRF